jgi:hypothetical protein
MCQFRCPGTAFLQCFYTFGSVAQRSAAGISGDSLWKGCRDFVPMIREAYIRFDIRLLPTINALCFRAESPDCQSVEAIAQVRQSKEALQKHP